RSRTRCSRVPRGPRQPPPGSPATGRARARNAAPKPFREPTESVRPAFYPPRMASRPTRIDLLELDIDLRLADLWREAAGIGEWSLDVVAAFMRAAYGKGYCDALTEDAPGTLCADHGYRVPGRKQTEHADV